jgi:hypothetical protein
MLGKLSECLDAATGERLAYPLNVTLEEQRRAFVLQIIGNAEIAAGIQAEAVLILARVLETGEFPSRSERPVEATNVGPLFRLKE